MDSIILTALLAISKYAFSGTIVGVVVVVVVDDDDDDDDDDDNDDDDDDDNDDDDDDGGGDDDDDDTLTRSYKLLRLLPIIITWSLILGSSV